ncbi:DUF2716 domain-containing protein [Streptomyces yangpuensis]|uniref:DUF2716 domain-containing protein n=1 Tax=Streptomyces yangpuensis TaxID=1648182 RepID=UPI000629898E
MRSCHWHPPGVPEPVRPAQFHDWLHDWLHDNEPLWDRFPAAFDFRPSAAHRPAITEPAPSALWHLHSRHRVVSDLPRNSTRSSNAPRCRRTDVAGRSRADAQDGHRPPATG